MTEGAATEYYGKDVNSLIRRVHAKAARSAVLGFRRALWRTEDDGISTAWMGTGLRILPTVNGGSLATGRVMNLDEAILQLHTVQGTPVEAIHYGYVGWEFYLTKKIGRLSLRRWALVDTYDDGTARILDERRDTPARLGLRSGDMEWFVDELKRGVSGEAALPLEGSPLDRPRAPIHDDNWLTWIGLQPLPPLVTRGDTGQTT